MLEQTIKNKVLSTEGPTLVLDFASNQPPLTTQDTKDLVVTISQKISHDSKIKSIYLTLNENFIKSSGCEELMALKDKLTHLEVADNDIDDSGALYISQLNGLSALVIDCNKISEKGFLALTRNKSLNYLSICYNDVSDRAVRELLQEKNSKLIQLDLRGNPKVSQTALDEVNAWLEGNKKKLAQMDRKEEKKGEPQNTVDISIVKSNNQAKPQMVVTLTIPLTMDEKTAHQLLAKIEEKEKQQFAKAALEILQKAQEKFHHNYESEDHSSDVHNH